MNSASREAEGQYMRRLGSYVLMSKSVIPMSSAIRLAIGPYSSAVTSRLSGTTSLKRGSFGVWLCVV